MSETKARPPKANPPLCWECNRLLYGGGRIYHTVEVDGIARNVHAACLRKTEEGAR